MDRLAAFPSSFAILQNHTSVSGIIVPGDTVLAQLSHLFCATVICLGSLNRMRATTLLAESEGISHLHPKDFLHSCRAQTPPQKPLLQEGEEKQGREQFQG